MREGELFRRQALGMGVSQPAGGTDAHARHLEYLEVGDRGLGEAIAKGFVSGLKEQDVICSKIRITTWSPCSGLLHEGRA
jgi:hypothetical protein